MIIEENGAFSFYYYLPNNAALATAFRDYETSPRFDAKLHRWLSEISQSRRAMRANTRNRTSANFLSVRATRSIKPL